MRQGLVDSGTSADGAGGRVLAVPDPIRAAGLLRTPDESPARGNAVRRAALRGDVRRVHLGAYVGSDHWEELDPAGRRQVQVRAAVAAARSPVLVSHTSAAVLWGLPVVGAPDERVHLTFVGDSGGMSRGAICRHVVAVPPAEEVVDGMRLTSVARTVADLGRTCGFLTGVVAGDAALRRGLVSLGQIRAEVAAADRGRGVRAARDVAAFVDGRSESPGESLSRVRIRELGLAPPTLQHVVTDARGFVGRVDFWWDEYGVIGEFDGRSKYGLDADTSTAADRLWKEKVREDRLRATGAAVARWTWAEAWAGAPMASILRRAGVR